MANKSRERPAASSDPSCCEICGRGPVDPIGVERAPGENFIDPKRPKEGIRARAARFVVGIVREVFVGDAASCTGFVMTRVNFDTAGEQ